MVTATAPGKVILVGEHAVVYGRPAIAVPVWETVATATVRVGQTGHGCIIRALDTGSVCRLADAPAADALALVTRLTLEHLGVQTEPDWEVELSSVIPIASGMGSGAALSAALVKALHLQAGVEPQIDGVSQLVYEGERLYHGTPSGIDNTVVAHGKPIWYVKGEPPVIFEPGRAFRLAIADSGVPSPTKQTVGGVRRRWEAEPARYEGWFDEIAGVVTAARKAIVDGAFEELGSLFNRNHMLLVQIGVSIPILDELVEVSRQAGAGGAKLSGGGGGGNIIALVEENHVSNVTQALLQAGAKRVLVTHIGP